MDENNLAVYVGNKIKYYRELNNLTQTEIAEVLETTRQSVSRYETGDRKANQDVLFKLADEFNISINDFFPPRNKASHFVKDINVIYNQLEPPLQTRVYDFANRQLHEQNNKVVPLVGTTAANPQVANYADQINDISINTDVPNNADCALVVRGDSMEPDYIDGSIVFYKRQNSVENGELAIVEIEGEGVTFKKVLFDYDNQQVILRSLNKNYDDRVLTDEEYRIIGKVVK